MEGQKKKGRSFGPAAAAKKEKSEPRMLDAYYTKDDVALQCVDTFLKFLSNGLSPIWIEPSVGGGAFLRAMQSRLGVDASITTIDTNQKTDATFHTDFLSWFPELSDRPIICIGNPPFGKNSSTALQFVNHSAKFASIIGFILPNSFQKPSIIKRIDKSLHLVHCHNLEGECFVFEDKSVHVPCSFYIFEKRNIARVDPEPLPTKSSLVSFLSDSIGATFMVQRVGRRAGRIWWDAGEMEQRKGSANFYFVRVDNLTEEQRVTLSGISMEISKDRLNTSGMPSLSKGEVVKMIHDALDIKITL